MNITEGAMTEIEADEKSKKDRSPSFPFIPLRKAVERARTMLTAHRKNPTRPGTLGETWGYSSASSGLIQTIAALKAYGLIDDIGRGEDRRVQLSDLAARIINDARPGARETAITEAAVNPKILAEYWNIWHLERPSDSHCISELTLDRGFTPEAAKLFLRIYDDNISYASLNISDKISDVSEGEQMEVENDRRSTSAVARRPMAFAGGEEAGVRLSNSEARSAAPAIPAATLPLPEGLVTLTIPSSLSERSVKALKAWIEVIVGLATEPPNAD
jgi:hypothetical protein